MVKEFSDNMADFDDKISNFPDIYFMKHVNATTFKSGLTHIISTNTHAESTNATGGGGGFCSNDFVTALFMMYFAIGNTGKIIPNTKFYMYDIKGKPTIRGNF